MNLPTGSALLLKAPRVPIKTSTTYFEESAEIQDDSDLWLDGAPIRYWYPGHTQRDMDSATDTSFSLDNQWC